MLNALPHPSHFDPGSMEHDTDHPAKSEPQHQRQPFNTIADTTPLPEAQNTQKNKLRPTSGSSRRHASNPYPNHPDETHTQATLLNKALDPAITTQTQFQPHPSHSTPMDHDTNHDDDETGTYTKGTSGHPMAWREPNPHTSEHPQ